MKCLIKQKKRNFVKSLYVGCSANSRDDIKRVENNGVRQQAICNRNEMFFYSSANKIAKFGKIFIRLAIWKSLREFIFITQHGRKFIFHFACHNCQERSFSFCLTKVMCIPISLSISLLLILTLFSCLAIVILTKNLFPI